MSNLQNSLIQALGYSSNTNSISEICNLLKKNTSSAASTNASKYTFAALLAQLNRNLDSPQTSTSSYSNFASTSSYKNKIGTTPSISAIAQKIKDDDNPVYSTEEKVAQYLLDNYGGDKESVIMALTGAQSIPLQMTALEDQIFRNIVSKVSTQVRNTMYKEDDLSSLSSYDMSTDSSVSDSTTSSDISEL